MDEALTFLSRYGYLLLFAWVVSARVALLLRRKGFRRVRPLEGGLAAWRSRGFPVESPTSMEGSM